MNSEPHPVPASAPDASAASGDDAHQWLSALADGDPEALQRACALWRDDAAARERWHAYHLIGDVLRSDELASVPGQDVAFLARLRERLSAEPVPLAPTPSAAPVLRVRHLGWRAPAAVAAGFVAVAGVLVLTRGVPVGAPDSAGPVLATAPVGAGTPVRAPLGGAQGAPQWVLSGDQIRDAQLDAYLLAHQAARGGAPAALPGGGLRSAEMIVVPVMPAASHVPATTGVTLPGARK
jgi:sigma-E factor negative regulatory protein RseA